MSERTKDTEQFDLQQQEPLEEALPQGTAGEEAVPAAEPDQEAEGPDAGDAEPESGETEPVAAEAEPDAENAEPDAGETEPDAGDADPEPEEAEADAGEMEPEDAGSDAENAKTGAGTGEPDIEAEDPEGPVPGSAGAGRRRVPAKRNRKHRRKNWLARLVIAALVIAALFAVLHLSYFEIREIPVIGNKVVSDEEILELSGLEPGDNIALINPWLVKSRIKDNLYIRDVELERKLPGVVEIIVKERDAAAQFIIESKSGKKTYIITDIDGMVMDKSDKRKKVTLVDGVELTRAVEGEKVKTKESGAYKRGMNLILTAQQGDLYFKRINIEGSMIQAYIFDDLYCKGRYKNIMHAITSGELKAVVYRLYQQDVTRGVINIGDNNYCSFTPKN